MKCWTYALALFGGTGLLGALLFTEMPAFAGGNNGTVCNNPGGPDVIVGDIRGTSNYPSVGGIEAFAFGTESCNIGDEELWWYSGTNEKPVIGQSLHRIKNGRLEMLGQGWLKNGFYALSSNWCDCGCDPTDGSVLGVGCSDLYNSGLNGSQSGMSAKYEVNAFTGEYPYPGWNLNSTGDGIYKRLQVPISDLDPAQDGGGIYIVEAQYITPDDHAAGNAYNNTSWVQGDVSGSGDSWNIDIDGYTTQRERTVVEAWADLVGDVTVSDLFVQNEGRVLVGSTAIALGNGVYQYEYAVQNMNSDRSIDSITIPIEPGSSVYEFEFNDVDYHSGSPIDGTDWTVSTTSNSITWACAETYQQNEWANAIRWGTVYSFSFKSTTAPQTSTLTLGVFKPPVGNSQSMTVTGSAVVPTGSAGGGDCNGNGVNDADDIANGTSSDCNGNNVPDECETLDGDCESAFLEVASGYSSLVFAAAPPADFDRLFLVEQTGRIKILDTSNWSNIGTFLNISGQITTGGERGLLGLAFDPDYDTNGYFYVNYTDNGGDTVVSRFTVSGDPNVANASSETIIISIDQDFSNHNGGAIEFGPDGMLYVGMGDGGSGGDPNNRAQNRQSLLGKMLRLDTDNPPSYIPADNPFVGDSSTRDEIWSLGLRNPWRFTFDRATGDMWIGDVGQNAYEEIDFEPAGSGGGYNWGWRCYEGNSAYNTRGCSSFGSYDEPIWAYGHSGGACTVIGGYVYRGCESPSYQGTYFYAEYCADWIKTFQEDNGQAVNHQDVSSELGWSGSNGAITSFAEDAAGELYIVTASGRVYRLTCQGTGGSECGNGIVEPGEECDDGNDVQGDGCYECQIEDNPNDGADLCENAPEVIVGENPFSTAGAGAEYPDPDDGQCSGTYLDWQGSPDVWFTFSPTIDGELSMTTCDSSSYDTSIALYEGAGCGDWTQIACNGDASGGSGCQSYYSAINDITVTAGQIYFIRIGGWQGASGDGTLTVSYEANGKDCNGNGIEDSIDIAEGKSSDCNSNGVPDECDLANGLSGDCDGGPSGVKSAGQYLIDTWCFGCHGDDGGGGKGYPGPSLRDKRRTELWTMLRTPTDHPGGSHDEFTQQDFADLEAFLADGGAYGRPDEILDICQSLSDCDGDGDSDGCEVEAGTQTDMNWDGVPDDCLAPCPGDVTADGMVDVADLLLVISDWGTTGSSADCSSPSGPYPDGLVNISDLLQIISDWGCAN